MYSAHLPTEPVPDPHPEPPPVPEPPMPIEDPLPPIGDPLGLRALALSLCALFAFSLPAHAIDQVEQGVSDTGVQFLAGGVAEDSQNLVMSQSARYNLELLFLRTDGAYMADVGVAVLDARGKKLIETDSPGPFFLVRLPPGNYRVMAGVDEAWQTRNVRIAGDSQRRVVFRWAEEP